MDVRRTIYDKFGDVMKKIDSGITGGKKEDTPDLDGLDSEIIEENFDDTDPSNNTEALWDLSELDPEIYEDVFEPVLNVDEGDQSESTDIDSDSDINIIDAADLSNESKETSVTPNFEKPKNLKTVSVSSDEESDSEEDSDEEFEEIQVSEIMDEDSSEMDDLFADKIEVRPQVGQLLDKHGTVTIEQLKQELLEVYELLSKK